MCKFGSAKSKAMRKGITVMIIHLLAVIGLQGQPVNNDCQNAIELTNISDWCSDVGAFSNTGATPSGYGAPGCWVGGGGDVWFQFTAQFTDFTVTVIGEQIGGQRGGTIRRPQLALYGGVCGGTINELECRSDISGAGIVSLFQGGLIPGELYYIRMSGFNTDEGTFRLCVNNYNPPVMAGQDCATKGILCDKSPFVVQVVRSAGSDPDEGRGTCLDGGNAPVNSEQQSTWYSWVAANDGTLTFIITPLNPSDDIDWALYEFPDGLDDCENREVLRCVATSCSGPTGLDLTSNDLEEDYNCEADEDGFVRFIDMEAGKAYGLLINNFSNTGIGFNIEFGGTGEFQGPEADFSIDPPTGLKCEESFTVTNLSSFNFGEIVRYSWNFGKDAVPQSATGEGPHEVNYNSFGDKFITLTIESDSGCVVTAIERFYVEPCCEDLPDLDIQLIEKQDLDCFGVPVGSIQVGSTGGTPEYSYRIDGGKFGNDSQFDMLTAGTYTVVVQDIKGCRDSIDVSIIQPPATTVDAGPDQEVLLGDFTNLNAVSGPPGRLVSFQWTGPNMSCQDCPSPRVQAPGTTTYYVQVTDSSGCTAIDSVTVRVRIERPFFAPNVFTANNDGVNDYFTIYGGAALESIDELQIWSRWGELVWDSGGAIPPNDEPSGWDGSFNGREMNPGVFVWKAKLRFIDQQVYSYTGDVTLMR